MGSLMASKGSVNVGKIPDQTINKKKTVSVKNDNTSLWKRGINGAILHDRFSIQTKYILS